MLKIFTPQVLVLIRKTFVISFIDLTLNYVNIKSHKKRACQIRQALAVRGGFEPPVRLNTVRRFSKPVISATHPPNQFI